MSNPLHEIDKLFRDGIEGRSEYPPGNVWDNIELQLDKESAIHYKRKYNSLKRKTSFLLVLFLGVIIYGTVQLYGRKENVAEPRHEPTASVQLQKTGYVGNSVEKEEGTTLVQDANAVLGKSGNLKADQSPVVINTFVKEINNTETDLINTEQGKAPEIIANRKKGIAVNQALNDRIITGKNDFTILSPVTANADEVGDGLNTTVNSLTRENRKIGYIPDHERRKSSFTITLVDDSWKKDIATGLKPALSAPALPDYAAAKKINHPGRGNSRVSFSAYISPNIAWTALSDDRYHRRRGSGNPGGNNGGGNNGGNNGGGNNGSGNNGGSNGGGGRGGRGDNRNEIKQSESENLAYSGGVKVNYNLSKKISLQTGLNYMINFTSVKPKLIFAVKDRNGDVGYRINCSSGYSFLKPKGASNPSIGDSTVVSDTRNTVSYLGVPVIVEYKILSAGRFSLSASTGAQVNILLNGKTKSVFGKGTANETAASSKTQGLKKTYFSAITGLTAEMRLKDNLSLILAPAGQFGLSYMNMGTSVKSRPNYLGLAAGLKLRL